MTNFNVIVGNNIKAKRLQLGISQSELGHKLPKKRHQQAIARYELGECSMSIRMLYMFAKALECKTVELLEDESTNLDKFDQKIEGKLIKSFREIPAAEGKKAILKMAKETAKFYSTLGEKDGYPHLKKSHTGE